MDDGRRKENLSESVRNAFTGYTMVVLGLVCFVLVLVVVVAVVRLIVGAGAAVSA